MRRKKNKVAASTGQEEETQRVERNCTGGCEEWVGVSYFFKRTPNQTCHLLKNNVPVSFGHFLRVVVRITSGKSNELTNRVNSLRFR